MVVEVHDRGKFIRINDIDCDKNTPEKINFIMACFPAFSIIDREIDVYDRTKDFLDEEEVGYARGYLSEASDNWEYALKNFLEKYDDEIIEIEILGYIRG